MLQWRVGSLRSISSRLIRRRYQLIELEVAGFADACEATHAHFAEQSQFTAKYFFHL